MPDAQGVLSPSEKTLVQKFLQSKTSNLQCPVCGSGNWSVGDQAVVCVPVGQGGHLNLGGQITPMVQLISNDCGYVLNFAAIPMGIKF